MMTAIVVTLLVGVGLGVAVGVPLGRAVERIRPRGGKKSDLDEHKAKKKSDR